jgi:hypothetical protein
MPVQGQNKKISQFTLATSLTNNDVMPIVNGGDTKKVTLDGLTNFITNGLNVNTVITGGTYDNNTGIITFVNVSGGTFDVTGFFKPSDDVYVTGLTFDVSNYNLTISRNDAWSTTESLSILATDMRVTGGTYDKNTGVVTFKNNSGGTFNVSGFTSGYTDTVITNFSYTSNTLTIDDSSGRTFTTVINEMTGLTVNGDLIVSSGATFNTLNAISISSNIISATTTNIDSLTANTISATTVSASTYYGDGSNLSNVGITVSANTGLGRNGNSLFSLYNTTLDGTLTMDTTIGGLSAGTAVSSLTGKTLVQLFDDILFPIANPTYTIPTIAMTGPSTQTVEVGSTYSRTISVFGIKNDAGIFSQLRVLRNGSSLFTDTTFTVSAEPNVPNQFTYPNPNSPNFRYTITPSYSESYIIPAPVVGNSSTTTYNGDGNYVSGSSKNNNKGFVDTRTPAVRSVNAPQAASNNFQTTIFTVTGIYPYFWGTSDNLPTAQSIADTISAGTANKVLSSASGTISVPYNVAPAYIWVAYYSGYTTKTRWWVNDFDTGLINGSPGSFITTAVTQSVDSPDSYWSGINYKMHWSVNSTVQQTLEFRNN